ncbi:MAG: hypothetical protein KAH30_03985 [Caldisericia bacterium]|nr:hypothetical protein [Caldisericia bacterium]
MDSFWQAIISYVIPLLSIVVGLVAIFISVRLSRTTEKALGEIKRNLDRKVAKSIKSLEDANKYIRESSANIQTDLIDLIKDSRLPNDQLTSHARSDTDFIVSNLDNLEIKILRACEKFPGSTPRFTPGKSKTPDPKPKAGKKFKDYLKGKNQEEADTSISKLIGFELIDFVTNPKKPTERILKLTEKGCGIVTILRERKLLPD